MGNKKSSIQKQKKIVKIENEEEEFIQQEEEIYKIENEEEFYQPQTLPKKEKTESLKEFYENKNLSLELFINSEYKSQYKSMINNFPVLNYLIENNKTEIILYIMENMDDLMEFPQLIFYSVIVRELILFLKFYFFFIYKFFFFKIQSEFEFGIVQ